MAVRRPTLTNLLTGPGLPVAVVIALGSVLAWRHGEPTAGAVLLDPSEYLIVSGRSGRGDEEVLWLLDTRSEELVVVGWDRTQRTMVPMGRREIDRDVTAAMRTR